MVTSRNCGLAFSTGVVFASATTAVALVSVVISVRAEWVITNGEYPYRYLFVTALVLVATWFVALRSDARRAISPLMLAALAPAWFGVLMLGPSYTFGSIPFDSIGQLMVLLLLAVVGVAAATLDPRLLAGTLIWLGFNTIHMVMWHSEHFIATDFAWLVGTSAVFATVLGLGMRFGVRRLARV